MSEARVVNLTGVPETMLWTLHNRANEALRKDGILRDADAVRIYESIHYDYAQRFGKPDGSHAIRSRVFDDAVRPWIRTHPGGTVIELAAGLETQFQRVDDGRVQWRCVDVPEAIAVRERFLPAGDRCRYVAKSALDLSWMDEVDPAHGVFVTAQGLFMYFQESEVRTLVVAMVNRFPGMELMFDAIPAWFSEKTKKGWGKTRHYRAPPMPWGIARSAVASTLRAWSPRITRVRPVSYGYIRGAAGTLLPVLSRVPVLRDMLPSITRVETSTAEVPT